MFIGLEGCIAIASTAMLITVTRQNAFIMNYPMGYEKDNLIYLDFRTAGPRYLDKIKSQAFVEEVGAMNCLPMYRYRVMFPNGGGALGYIEAQRSTFDMLGIEINDYVDAYKSEFDLNTNPYALDVINRYKEVRDMFTLTLDSIMERLHLIDKTDKTKTRNIFDELASQIQ